MMLSSLIGILRHKFPGTPTLTTDELEARLQEERDAVVLLDTRNSDEYQVSHLEGARHLNFEAEDDSVKSLLRELRSPRGEASPPITIVCYCSVGYRSAIMTNRIRTFLAAENETPSLSIFNLEGSIFKWANEQRAMVTPTGVATTKAHPYNYVYGWGLEKTHWKWS